MKCSLADRLAVTGTNLTGFSTFLLLAAVNMLHKYYYYYYFQEELVT